MTAEDIGGDKMSSVRREEAKTQQQETWRRMSLTKDSSSQSHAAFSARDVFLRDQQHPTEEDPPPNDLGERVVVGQSHRRSMDPETFGRRMCWTVGVLAGGWAFLLATVGVFMGVFLPQDGNTLVLFDEFLTEDVYGDIAESTLPTVQRWYRSLDEPTPLLPSNRSQLYYLETNSNHTTTNTEDCVSSFFEELTRVVNTTSPAYIRLVLRSLSLQDNLLTQLALRDLLTAPQDVSQWVGEAAQCHAQSMAVQQVCHAYKSSTSPAKPDFQTQPHHRHVLQYFAHVFAVYQTLTEKAADDTALLTEFSNHMINVMESRETAYQETVDDPIVREFATVKYQGIAQTLHVMKLALATNVVPPALEKSLQINILEAAKVDIGLGHDHNARVGLALAAALQYGPVVEDHVATWRHGQAWTEAYIAWNMAFIVGSLGLNRIIKLMIPVVACTPQTHNGNQFVTPRVVSLALGLMHEFPLEPGLAHEGIPQEEFDSIQRFYRSNRANVTQNTQDRFAMAEAMGYSNLYHTVLPSPSTDTVERMLYHLCNEQCHDGSWSITNRSGRSIFITDEDFAGWLAIILWWTVLLAGMGLELLVWLWLSGGSGWSKSLEKQWWLAQFVFPLLATTCLGLAAHQNYMALPFLVAGLWKFGMPESISYMYMALYDRPCSKRVLLSNVLNSVGTLLHHSSATIPIVVFLSGRAQADRHVLDPILLLVMQHWFVLTKYLNFYLYCALELAAEFFFELAVFSEMQYLHSRHWTLMYAALGMLLAHWLYLLAGALELLAKCSESSTSNPAKRTDDEVPLCAKDNKGIAESEDVPMIVQRSTSC